MKRQNEFISFLLEQMQVASNSGSVSARAMFGGHGLYFNDLNNDRIMFALVADNVLYFKTDAQNRCDFEAEGLQPFIYEKDGRQVIMSYYAAPEAVFDEPEEMRQWMAGAIDAAHRSRNKK